MPKFLISLHSSEVPDKPDIYEVQSTNRKSALNHVLDHQARRHGMDKKDAKIYGDMIIDAFDHEEYTMDHQEQRPVMFEVLDEGMDVTVVIIPIFNIDVPEARLVDVTA